VSGATPAEIFLQEASDLLEQLEQALLDLEHTPQDMALIDTAFRALHTIKGSGGMFGFEAVAAFTHHVENAFDQVRHGKIAPSPALIALALRAKDYIRLLIDSPGQANAGEERDILAGLAGLCGHTAPQTLAEQVESAAETADGWRIFMRLPADTLVNGTNPLLLLDELRQLGEARVMAHGDAVPPLDEMDPGACYVTWTIDLATSRPRTDIEDVFIFVIDEMELKIERPGADGTPPQPQAAAESAPSSPVVSTSASATAPTDSPAKTDAKSKAADSVRVPAERLDDLMDRVGELVIAQSRLSQVARASKDPAVQSIAEDIERLALELRDSTMGVRTVPIRALFSRFRRLVHDLSGQLGKEIALVTVGEETELDKTLIDKLSDPLIHLLRNSIDHGLETPEARLAAGKPRGGEITLTARHAGAEVLVCIKDDGKGLDREKIRARGEERGLVAPGAQLSDDDLFRLIFEPGFSTAAQVTSLSGRGVGMDVVKRTIESLRGRIDITSTPGQGTELTLRLPLTLAIIDGLLVRVGNGRYVLPLGSVEECVELSAAQDARARGCNFLNIRSELVPFLRLRDLFQVTSKPDPYQKVVIMSAGNMRVGLVVDQVIGQHQTVIKSLSRLHADLPMFSGATILGDGEVALILDIAHLVEFGQTPPQTLREAG
jgi:two-component system chemotaxis sensor kinase CheA